MIDQGRWAPGETVVLRDTGHFVGEVWAMPLVVIEDSDELVALYRPEGAPWLAWNLELHSIRKLPFCRMDMLRLMYPGRDYAVELFFDTGNRPPYEMFEGEGRFRGWKVNIEAPFQRTPMGFDTTDEFLDIYVMPDHSWYWAYFDHLDFWLNAGGYDQADRDRLMAAGRDAEAIIRSRLSPFDDTWTGWRAASSPTLDLTIGWHALPGAEVSLGSGRRYDAWKNDQDADIVLADWRTLSSRQKQEPLRRFSP